MKTDSSKRLRDLETMAVLAGFFLVLFFIKHYPFFAGISLCLLIVGLFFKGLSSKISRLWLGFSHLLGGFMNNVVLGAVFFIVLTPVALLYRLLGKSTIKLVKDPSAKSYFAERNKTFAKEDFEKMW